MSDQKQITIHSAKLVTPKGRNAEGKHLEVSFTVTRPDGTKEKHDGVLFTANPHEDLRAAFRKLSFHIANMTDQFDSDGEFDTRNIDARSFSISGEGDKEAVILTGVRTLESAKCITINTPLERLQSESDNAYDELDSLNKLLNVCTEEVRLYAFEAKHAADPQQELFVPEEEATEA